MEYLVACALLFIVLAWIANTYHKLAQLNLAANLHWEESRTIIRERNQALKEFTYLLSIHEGQDQILRQLRRTQGDLDINLSHTEAQAKGKDANIERLRENEHKLQQLLQLITTDVLPASSRHERSKLHEAYQLLLLHERDKRQSLQAYNESIQAYNLALNHGGNRFIGGIFHFFPRSALLIE